MRRIGLAVVLALELSLMPLPAQAEPGGRIPRIAFISTTSPPGSPAIEAFRSALRDLGYVENQTSRSNGAGDTVRPNGSRSLRPKWSA
jgi:hypothetical protein